MWLLLTISSKLFKLTLWNDKVSCVQNILSGPVYEIKSLIKFSLLHVIIINFNYRWRCCFLTRSFLVLNVNRSRKNTLISTKWHILCLPRRGWTSNRSRRFHTGNIPIETYCFPVELGKKIKYVRNLAKKHLLTATFSKTDGSNSNSNTNNNNKMIKKK